MKIVFFGSSPTSLYSLKQVIDKGHSVELIITQPDRPSGRGRKAATSVVKEFAVASGLPYIQPTRIRKDPTALDTLQAIKPDLNVVVAYGQIIPAAIIYLPKHNSINLHFSMLPLYRGASPVQWAILKGEESTGVTIFELDEKMDEGPILSQSEIPIMPGENAQELEARLSRLGADLLIKTIDDIGQIQPQNQDHTLATYAPLIKKEDGKVQWNNSAVFIERQIRAFFPWPSTFTFLKDRRVKLIKGQALTELTSGHKEPGTVLDIHKDGIDVCCGDKTVFQIQELQPENKKAMHAHAFSLGAQLQPGDTFS